MLLDTVFPSDDPLGDYPRIAIPFVFMERALTSLLLATRRPPRWARRTLVSGLRTYTGETCEGTYLEDATGRPLQCAARWLLEAPRSAPETTEPAAPLSEDEQARIAAIAARLTGSDERLQADAGTDPADRPSPPAAARKGDVALRMAATPATRPQRKEPHGDGRTDRSCACGHPVAESPKRYREFDVSINAWWILPGAFVGMWIWIGLLKLAGVL